MIEEMETIERLQQEIFDIKECLIEPLSMLEAYWDLIPNSHRMTCRECYNEAFMLTGLEVSDERD